MNIFIVHSSKDKAKADALSLRLVDATKGKAKILILENGGEFWKIDARKKIKMAQMVLFLVGEKTVDNDNIAWELKTALKYNKYIMTYQIDEEKTYEINQALKQTDRFTQKQYYVAATANTEQEIIDKIISYETGEYKVINETFLPEQKDELLEQYRIFLQTSETLVERRQNVNNFYISINTAIITVFGIICTLETDLKTQAMISFVIFSIAIILDVSWIKILESYGILNSSKMKIISTIEKKLPASLYDKEWDIMSDKLNSKKYISFTEAEKQVPKLFILFFSALAIISIILTIR